MASLLVFLGGVQRDLWTGIRAFRRARGFVITIVGVLALGIGANTAVFSVVDAVLLRPLPYPEPDRIVRLRLSSRWFGSVDLTSVSRFVIWREYAHAFQYVAAYDTGGPALRWPAADSASAGNAVRVSAHYFPLFGARVALGRTFEAAEDRPGGRPVAVISARLCSKTDPTM